MKPAPLSAALRAALRADQRSCKRLAQDAGLSPAVLSRFLAGTRGLTLASADRLAAELGLRLVEAEKVRQT